MPAVIFFFGLSLASFAVTSEGFIREKAGRYTIERGLDRSELPTVPGCDGKTLSRYRNHYVKAEWDYVKDKDCFELRSIKRIVYDPLKGTSRRR